MPTTSDGRADRLQGFARLFELAPFVGHKWGVGVLHRTLKCEKMRVYKDFLGCHRLVYCPNLTKKERIMDPDNKKRISIYMDKDIVEKADKALKVCGCSSRNELVAKAIEYFRKRNRRSESISCDKNIKIYCASKRRYTQAGNNRIISLRHLS